MKPLPSHTRPRTNNTREKTIDITRHDADKPKKIQEIMQITHTIPE
jgi:hypothetical protein